MSKYQRREDDDDTIIDDPRNKAPEDTTTDGTPPTDSEEATFKKRYGDLRRHSQEQQRQLQTQIDELKAKLDAASKEPTKLPKTEKEIEAWAKKYPDVAAIIETIARKRALEVAQEAEGRLKGLQDLEKRLTKERAEAELVKLHPDFHEITAKPEFHEWVAEQPQNIQDSLYKNSTDYKAAARAIDLYKADTGKGTKRRGTDRDAASAVGTRGGATPSGGGRKRFSESQVAKMSAQEYEKNEDAILDAIRKGEFDYDLSGGAR